MHVSAVCIAPLDRANAVARLISSGTRGLGDIDSNRRSVIELEPHVNRSQELAFVMPMDPYFPWNIVDYPLLYPTPFPRETDIKDGGTLRWNQHHPRYAICEHAKPKGERRCLHAIRVR